MIESTINQREMRVPHFVSNGTEQNSALLNGVDATQLENDINLKQKASYAEFNNTPVIAFSSPQLTAPTANINSSEASITAVIEQFGKLNSGVSIAELNRILKANKELTDSRWKAFETELNNFINAENRLDKALTILEGFKDHPDTPQEVIDAAIKEVEEAFENLSEVLEKLKDTVAALPPSTDARHLQSLLNAKPALSFLDQLLIRMQEVQKDYMLTVPEKKFKFVEKLQTQTIEGLIKIADKNKKALENQSIGFEVGKWLTLFVTTIFSFASAGSLSFLVGLASAAFIAIDFGTDGLISEKVLEPVMTKTLGLLMEKMVMGISEELVKAGADEGTAMATATVASMVILALATYGVGKAASAGLSTQPAQAFMASVETAMSKAWTTIQATLPEWLKAAPAAFFKGIAKVDKFIIKSLFGGPGIKYERAFEMYLHRISQLQVAMLAITTATEMPLQIIMGIMEKSIKEFEADTEKLSKQSEILEQQTEHISEKISKYVQKRNEYDLLRSDLLDSEKNLLRGVYSRV